MARYNMYRKAIISRCDISLSIGVALCLSLKKMKLSGSVQRLTYQSVFYRALVTRRVRSQSGAQAPGTFILNPVVIGD